MRIVRARRYVGRTVDRSSAGAFRNVDFDVHELAPDAAWVADARRAHAEAAAAAGHRDAELLRGGECGSYSWSQTDGELEVNGGAPAMD